MEVVHLQVTTAYSLLSSTIPIQSLVERAKEYQFKAVAITDHNVLYGVLPFYKSCRKAGIKPIIGMAADVASEDLSSVHPVVLLAENNTGYENLLKISSVINTEPEKHISRRWLQAYSEGLIAITPGVTGEIEQALLQGDMEEAEAAAHRYLQMFGSGSFYLSMQNHYLPTEQDLLEKIYNLSQRLDIQVVATNDVQYIDKGDAFALKCMEAIRNNEKLQENNGLGDRNGEFYFKDQQEMNELFSSYPQAIKNTVHIANRCNVKIETNRRLLPKYPLPEDVSAQVYLQDLCKQGLEERGINEEAYHKRLRYELSIIHQMNFNDYFLIVWDFMKFARDHHILTGPGRGSAAGSLVAYSLGITDVDPIKYGLLFERFLNPERISMPDIDIDFPDHRRDEVINYVVKKYGKKHVAHIITFGTFAARAAVRDIARVFNLTSKEIDHFAKAIPPRLGITLNQALKESERLRALINSSERNHLLFEIASKIEGLPRHASTHAAGIVISEKPLAEIVPVQGGFGEDSYLTQFPMEDLEELGLLKMDFLGLRNLSLLERIVKSIELHTGRRVDLQQIPLNDQKTFSLLQKGDTTGIFQLESEGMRNVLRNLRPTGFEDIVAVNALYRPGPMENIPAYVARKHGKQQVFYPHPDLKPILELTYGVIVYQEQIMQIASVMAGFSLGEADLLRRAMSKKNKDVLAQERKHFVRGAVHNGYDEKTANETYDFIIRFANYGFNRSHAVAYSFIAWRLAWLKAHYPNYFLAGLLTSVIGNEDKIAQYVAEAKQKGLSILPPSINKSHFPFLVEDKGIRFSLGAIRGVGAAALKEIIQVRQTKPFEDLFDFCLRVSPRIVNRKIIENLIHSGSFDEFGQDRAVLLATIDIALEHAELMSPALDGHDLFEGEEFFQVKPKYMNVDPISLTEKLAYEKEVLGVYISDHPVSPYTDLFKGIAVPLLQLKRGDKNKSASVYLTNAKTIRTKKGDVMAFVSMSDPSGEMEGVVFPNVYNRRSALCKTGQIVLVSGDIEERNGKSQFIIKDMRKPDEVRPRTVPEGKVLYIKIPETLHNPETLNHLQKIIKSNPGDTDVILYYEKNKQTLQLGEKNRVSHSEKCISDIQMLLGETSVVLK